MKMRRQKSRKDKKIDRFERKIFSKSWEGKSWKIVVSVTTFKGAKPKLLISRERVSQKYLNRPFAKLGRLSKEEVAGIIPVLQEALHHMH